jgi:hypothetical protein
MAIADRKPSLCGLSDERHESQRVAVNLLGRYMLEDRREFPCQVVDMSPGGMAVIAPVNGCEGERVIAYVDQVGRLEAIIVQVFENGFAARFAATARKRARLAAQLARFAKREAIDAATELRDG